jgi:phosphoribosylamine--glycine ligase
MLTDEGPKVLEYNTRFGDPECQALMLRLEDDLLPVLAAGAAGNFGISRLHFRKEASAVIVLASEGYPEKPERGQAIEGLAAAARHPNVVVFHAGTAEVDGQVVAAGGRVLGVAATGAELTDALRSAYAATQEISWPALRYRKDIGRRLVERLDGTAGGGAGT